MQKKSKWQQFREQKEQETVRTFIGIEQITANGVKRKEREEELLFFLLEPDNLSVLSEESIRRRVYGLMTVLKGLTDIEFCCVNSRENFTENKRYLKQRIRKEKNQAVVKLLEADLEELENMEQRQTGAREFLFLLRLRQDNAREVITVLSRVEKAFREQNIRVKRAEKEDVKRILSVYFTQQYEENAFEDYDGERWLMAFEEPKKQKR